MRAHTNIALKERRKFTLNEFCGVDLSSSALRVDGTRAADAVNWICERKVTQKRQGWNQILPQIKNKKTVAGEDGSVQTVYEAAPINGIIPYRTNGGKEELLICAGTELVYAYQTAGGEYRHQAVECTWSMSGNRVQGFVCGEKIYLVDGAHYLCYNCTTHKAYRVVPYIPITTQSIDPIGSDDSKLASLDEPNLLTAKRKNLLVGSALSKTDSCSWQLDSPIAANTTVTVTVTLMGEDGNAVTKTYSNRKSDSITRLYGDSNVDCGGVSFDFGRITLNRIDTTPPIENAANVTVEFTAASNGDFGEEVIDACRFGTIFGIDGAEDRLFLSGNPKYPNTVFFSESDDFSYFPQRYTATFGTVQSAVTAFLRLSDDVLAIFKEKTAGEAAVYYQSGSYRTEIVDTGDSSEMGSSERTIPVFSITAGNASECAVSPWSVANLAGDSLFLSERGVFALELTENLATNLRSVRERGRTIEKHLCERKTDDAVAVVFDGKLYLSEGGFCYVADSRYRYQPADSPSYHYEWWLWDHIPARVWGVVGKELWFGTPDGRVCRFEKRYSDRTFEQIPIGDITVDFDYNCMIYSDAVSVAENDRILLPDVGDDSLWRLYAADLQLTDDHKRLKLENGERIADIFEGDEVKLVMGNFSCDVCIAHVDRFEGSFSLFDAEGNMILWIDPEGEYIPDGDGTYMVLEGPPTLFKRLVGEYRITDVGGCEVTWEGYSTRNMFRLCETSDAQNTVLTLARPWHIETDLICETLIHETPVVASWRTPFFDMGDNTSSKTLLSLTVAEDCEKMGKLSFGFETKSKAWEREIAGVGAFSFDALDFCAFTMETEFQTCYTVRTREAFNYIRFHFLSDTPTPCSLVSLAAIYKINKRKKGVT